MASDKEFVAYVCEQLRAAGDISSKRMFGEAAVYLGDKVVGLVCDNQLFVKPTEAGRAKIGTPVEAAPYPGASNWFLMVDLDDAEWLAEVVRVTAAGLPERKGKKAKGKKMSGSAKKKLVAKKKVGIKAARGRG